MKIISSEREITFDDVLILSGYSQFLPQDEKKTINTSTQISKKLIIDVPIVSAPMPGVTEERMAITLGKLGGLGFIHPFQGYDRQLEQIKKVKENGVKVAASVVNLDDKAFEHVGKLLKAGADLISIEAGNAFNLQVIEFLKKIKKKYKNAQVSVGQVVTGEATKKLIEAGADAIRVGIGGGSHCTTRLVTGVGRPQLSAVAECCEVAQKYGVPIISDSGIKYAGDIAKAIVFGANVVMVGGFLAGTDESPGEIIKVKGKPFKRSWGMCTQTAMLQQQFRKSIKTRIIFGLKKITKRFLRIDNSKNLNLFEEGQEGLIPYQGSAERKYLELHSGLIRSMWYVGAKNLEELRQKSEIVLVSQNVLQENKPRI